MISDVALWALCLVVVLNTLFIVALVALLGLINRKLDEAIERSGPVLKQAAETLARVDETTGQVQQRVDRVLERTTELVNRVSERVETTTALAEEAVTEPLIGAASLMAGINRGLKVYTERSNERGDEGNGRQ